MEISKNNLFEMLGNDSRKYHSCIVTTFSFDFSFFELHAMRYLKNAGMRNILVLVDEAILNGLTENLSGFEFRQNPTYGIYPMSAKGVFHSKMIFCAGRAEGFLAIGSGNLTAAGHGSNDELWSAFHYKGENSPNAGIFSQAWAYIQNLKEDIKGNSLDKIVRMQEHSKWIGNLPISKPGSYIRLENELISLQPVSENRSLFPDIKAAIGTEPISSITCVSPFYDTGGRLIEDMRIHWPDADINVVVDCKFGSKPNRCQAQNINYFDWHSVYQNDENEISRLHGKLIVFKLKDNREFIVTGSSNATDAGIGLSTQMALNQELNLFIFRKDSNTLVSLGLHFSKFARISEQTLRSENKPDVFEYTDKHKKSLKIQFAELEGTNLVVGTSGSFKSTLQLRLFNRDGHFMDSIFIGEPKEKLAVKLNEKYKGAFLIGWYDLDGNQISGKAIIQDTNLHNLTNPDQKSEKLQSIFLDIENGNHDVISELLQHVNFSNIENGKTTNKNQAGMMRKEITEEESEYLKAKDYDEFTKVSEERILKQKHLLSSASLQIAEFLHYIQKKQMSSENDDINNDNQLPNLDQDEGIDDQNTSDEKKRTVTRNEFTRTRAALQNFLKQLSNYQTTRKKAVIDVIIRHDIPEIRMTINDYSNINIAIYLFNYYTNKQEDIIEGEEKSTDVYLKVIGQNPWDNLKSFIIDTLSGFILLAQQGDEELEEGNAKQKMIDQKRNALYNIIFLTCNAPFTKDEKTLVRIIQANALLLLFCQPEKTDELKKDLDKWVWEKYADVYRKNTSDKNNAQSKNQDREYNYLNLQFKSNYEKFSDSFYHKVADFSKSHTEKRRKSSNVHSLSVNESIFVSKYGICKIDKILPSKLEGKDQKRIALLNPGFKNGKGKGIKIEPFAKVIDTGIKI